MDEYPPVSEHGLIGDLQTAALVSTDDKAGQLTTQFRDQVPGADISPTDDTAISTAG
ncbi:hypothetical protein ACIQMV_15095 [Streptomyces sp. NPDC091412]|uniref:hypothetical protein n=1 Tax=Streptomyces sp. NPDC091412 TaxID=3366002 RepID=UPI00381FF6F0